jgi:hypothetical protein
LQTTVKDVDPDPIEQVGREGSVDPRVFRTG